MPVIDFTAAQGGILRINGFLRRGLSIDHGYGTGTATITGSLAVTLAEDTLVGAGTVTPMWVANATGAENLAAPTTGVTVTKPAGLADGDVLYAFVAKSNYANTADFTCSGWTQVSTGTQGDILGAGNDVHVNVLRKVITSAAGEPADYAFVTTDATTRQMAAIIACVRGANTATPENVVLGNFAASDDATPASRNLTTTVDNTLVLQFCMLSLGSTATKTWGAPSGYADGFSQTGTASAGSDVQIGVAYAVKAVAGAMGTNVWTHTANDATTENMTVALSVAPI